MLAQVPFEVRLSCEDPTFGLQTESLAFVCRPRMDLADVLVREPPQLLGLFRGAGSYLLDMCLEAVRRLGGDPRTLALGGRLHLSGDHVEERGDDSGFSRLAATLAYGRRRREPRCLVRQVCRLDIPSRRSISRPG